MPGVVSTRPLPPGLGRGGACLAVLVILLASGGCATTGTIRGTLVPPPSAQGAIRGKLARGSGWGDTVSAKRAIAYIVDDREPVPKSPPKLQPQRIRQTRAGFEPPVAVVQAGTTVSFENMDSIYHSAFSVEEGNRFDTGLYAPGQARPVAFDHPGIVKLYCSIHPKSSGLIVVTPNGHYARADARGEFKLPPLRPGSYTLKVWHPRYGTTSLGVRVPEDCRAPVRLVF